MLDLVLLPLNFLIRVESCNEPAHDIKVLFSLLNQGQNLKDCKSCLEQHLTSHKVSDRCLRVHIQFWTLTRSLHLEMAEQHPHCILTLLVNRAYHISLQELSLLLFNHVDHVLNLLFSVHLVILAQYIRKDLPVRQHYISARALGH